MIKQSVKLVWYGTACLIVAFALMITLMRFITPVLADKRLTFQNIASEILQRPIEIGSIHGEVQWFSPVLVFDDVGLFEKDKSKLLLKVHHVSVQINVWSSLLHWQIRPGTVVIDGAHVIVQHRADGHLLIAGIDALENTDAASNENALLDWLLSQKEIVLKHLTIQWITKDRHILPLNNVSVSLDNGHHHHHRFRGQFRLNQANASAFQIIGDLQGTAQQIEDWSGSLYLATDNLVLQQWLPEFPWSPANLQAGTVSGRFWLTLLNSKITNVKSHVAVKQLAVNVKSEKNPTPIIVEQATADLEWQHLVDGWTLSGDHVRMIYKKKQWPENRFKVTVHEQNDAHEVSAQCHYMNLGAMQDLFAQLQLPKMQGELRSVSLLLPMNEKAWSIAGSAINVGMSAYQSYPAFAGFDGDFNLSQASGDVKINTKKLLIGTSTWTPKIIQLETVQGHVHYQHVDDNWQVTADSLFVKQDPLIELRGGFAWRKTKEHPQGVLDAVAGFSLQQTHSLFDYLPKSDINPGLRQWLEASITTKGAISGKLAIQGDLASFPFVDDKGLFDLDLHVQDTGLKFHPHWPALEHANASVHIHNNQLTAVVNRTKLGRVWIDHGDIAINDLMTPHKILLIKARTHTQLADALPTLKGSPIEESIAPLTAMHASGPFDLDLDLQIPLQAHETAKVAGSVELEGATLHVPNVPIVLQKVAGKVNFSRDIIHAEDLIGWWDDQPLHATITTNAPRTALAATQVEVDSGVSQASIAKLLQSTWLEQLSGKTKIHASVSVPHEKSAPIVLALRSNLVGLGSNLPAPFNKIASDVAAFEYQSEISAHHQTINAKLQNGGRGIARFNKEIKGWRLQLDSPDAKGQIQMDATGKNQSLTADMARWHLHPSSGSLATIDPKTLPGLNIKVDDFQYDQKQFGKLILKTSKSPHGMRIDDFTLSSAPFELNANGSWEQHGDHTISNLRGEATSNDLSEMLIHWNIPPVVEAKRGYYRFDFSVPRPIYQAGLSDLNGQLHIQLNEGRITKLSKDTEQKLGLGKLLSVLSLQSLPNHLVQGFTDVSRSGFPYTIFSGDFLFEHGQAHTKNAELDGPIAYAKLNGVIGFNNKNYHLKIRVSPHLEATLPLVATIAGGPIAGAATWVATHVMSDSIRAVNHYDYALEGQWDAPTVKVG